MATWNINETWHYHPSVGGNMFTVTGRIEVTRATEQTTTVHISGWVTHTLSHGRYSIPDNFATNNMYSGISYYMQSNGTTTARLPHRRTGTWDTSGPYMIYRDGQCWHYNSNSHNTDEVTSHSSYTINYNEDMTWTSGNLNLVGRCSWLLSGECDVGSSNVTVASFGINNVPYNEYTQPSQYEVSPPAIMRIDKEYKPRVQITCGTGKVHWIKYKTYNGTANWNYGKWDNAGGNRDNYIGDIEIYRDNSLSMSRIDDTYKYTPNANGCAESNEYILAIHFSDNKYQWLSGNDRKFKTFRKPTMSITVPSSNVSPQNNATWSWSTNQRKWSDYEANFTTTGTCNGTTINNIGQGTTGSYTLNDEFLSTYFTRAQRSVAVMSGTVSLTRENTSAKVGDSKYTASDNKTFKIQYRPDKTPTGGNVTNTSGTSVKNTTIIVQDTPKINIDWSYPHSNTGAGVTNGYILRVYKDSNYSNKVGSDHIVSVSTAGASGTIQLNTKTDLQRGVMNYATITPYYTKPDDTGRLEGTNPLKIILCKPISKIDPPTIEYPINNSEWHNKYFRVLLQMPYDDDIQSLIDDNTIQRTSDYRYSDIQIKITPSSGSAITYSTTNSTIWSKAIGNITHNSKIAVCPGLISTFPNASSYQIQMRVKKAYYNLTEAQSWSDWTSAITIKNTAITNLSLSVGQEILATHYKTVRNASVRLYNTYPIQSGGLNGNIDQNRGDQIDYSEYQAIYNTILAIKNGVNGYCTYDNTDVSFARAINDLTTNPPKQEFITAEKTPSSIAGRNYKNILIDDMNKLY